MAASMCKSKFGYHWLGLVKCRYYFITVDSIKPLGNKHASAYTLSTTESRSLEETRGNCDKCVCLSAKFRPRPRLRAAKLRPAYIGPNMQPADSRPRPRFSYVHEIIRLSHTNYRNKASSQFLNNTIHCRSICTEYRPRSITGLGLDQYSRNYQVSDFNLNCRSYSDDGGLQKKVTMHLMDFPEIIWPSIIKSLRNWILANFIITPYFDQEFNLPDFIRGSKKALGYVSDCLSRSDYESLEGLVAPEAIQEIKRNISSFSMQQREELRIRPEDIYFSFLYQIGVMFSDDDKNQKRFVEITMCYHVLQGLDELKKQGTTPPINMGMMPEYRDKIHICNYRFIREFTKGVEGQWTINAINHFKPSDYVS